MLWQLPLSLPVLKSGQVHIWRAELTCTEKELGEFSALLNPQEKERAARFMVEGAASSFIVARGILRTLLAKYLQVNPQDLVFQQNQYGKLHLDSSPIQFNISHSRNLALFIFALHEPVGIDVEFIRSDYEFSDIAKRFFSKEEVAELFSLPKSEQLQAFFNCWSRKEAFIKALGVGLYKELDKFSVEVSSSKEGKLRLLSSDEGLDREHWMLEALDPGDGYAGAFVVGFSGYNINYYEFK